MKRKMKNGLLLTLATLAIGASAGAVATNYASAETTIADKTITFEAGASVRTKQNADGSYSAGIRFTANFSADIYNAVAANNATAGMVLVPKTVLDSVETAEADDYIAKIIAEYQGKTYENITVEFSASQFTENNGAYLAKGAIIDLLDANLEYEYQAVAYVYTKADRSDITYAVNADDNARSILQVAEMALEDADLTGDNRKAVLGMTANVTARLKTAGAEKTYVQLPATTVEAGVDLSKYVANPVTAVKLNGADATLGENNVLALSVAGENTVTLTYENGATLTLKVLATTKTEINVEGVTKYQLYTGMENGERVANAAALTIDAGETLPTGEWTWTVGGTTVSATVSGSQVTFADLTGVVGGEQAVVGTMTADGVTTTVNAKALLVNKVITTAEDFANIKAYGDISDERTYKDKPQYKFDGYFELGANVDLTGYTLATTFTTDTEDCPTNKQNEYGFIGTLDGCGYTVSGGTYGVGGLFGGVGSVGLIKNIAFVGATLQDTAHIFASIFYGQLENVLIDYTLGVSLGYAISSWIINAKLTNVVVYSPAAAKIDGQHAYAHYIPYKISTYGNLDPATFTNCYAFTNNTHGNKVCSDYLAATTTTDVKVYTLGTASSVITGLSDDMWNLNLGRAYFNNYVKELAAGYAEELAAVPTTATEGEVITLPEIPYVTYTVEGNATLNGNVLTVSNALEADCNVVVTADFSAYGVVNKTVTIAVKNTDNIVVNADKYEVYKTGAASALEVTLDKAITKELTWTANSAACAAVTLDGNKVTVDAVSGKLSGQQKLVGTSADGLTVVEINVLLVNKIITTAEELFGWRDYAYTTTGTISDVELTRFDGYFELGNNIDCTGKAVYQSSDGATQNAEYAKYGFCAVLDGKGYTVINATFGKNGLFGWVGSDGVIKNIAFANTSLTSETTVNTCVIASYLWGELNNVLIEINSRTGNVYGQGIAQFIGGATLKNVVCYAAANFSGNPHAAFAVYAPKVSYGSTGATTFENCYAFTNQTDGDAKGTIMSFLSTGQTASGISIYSLNTAPTVMTGFSNDIWNFNLDRAYFNSYVKELATQYDDEIAAVPTEVKETAETIALPAVPYATWSLTGSENITVSGNTVVIPQTLTADETVTLTLDMSAYGVANKTVTITVKNVEVVIVNADYEHYNNEADFTVNVGNVPEGVTYTVTDNAGATYDAGTFFTLADGVMTVAKDKYGYYEIVGVNADETYSIKVVVRNATKILKTVEDIQNMKGYSTVVYYTQANGTVSETETASYSYDGYFLLGNNIDLGTSAVGLSNTVGYDLALGFIGTFDGLGYTLIGGEYTNMFGAVGGNGTVKNVAFVNAAVVSGGVIGNFYGTMKNVLIDYSLKGSLGAGIGGWIGNATLENVVVYSPANATGDGQYAYATYIPYTHPDYGNFPVSTFTNCYAFTNNTVGYGVCCKLFGNTANNVEDIKVNALGTATSVISGVSSYWNLNGARARFNSYTTIA